MSSRIRDIVFAAIAVAWLCVAGQESAWQRFELPPLDWRLDSGALTTPVMVSPTLSTSPYWHDRYTLPERLDLDWRLRSFNDRAMNYAPPGDFTPRLPYDYTENRPLLPDRNPWAHDYSRSGVIARSGTGYLSGASSRVSMPGLVNMASASVAWTQPIDDNLTLTAGVTGEKYHAGRSVWNQFGVWGNARYRLNDRLSLNAFGQYYHEPTFNDVAMMSYQSTSRFGGSLGIKVSEHVSLDVGAQRYYDPYTHTWKTIPILAPTFIVLGQPISFDAGGFVGQLLEHLFGKDKHYDYSGYSGSSGMTMPTPAGFNPYSPVRIPDALRR